MSDLNYLLNNYIGKKVVLYGLGTETERVIRECGDVISIVGLLDGFRDSGEIYGQEILDLDKVLLLGVSVIIVVARPGSCKAISKRIGDFCRKGGIEFIDIRGKNLLDVNRVSYDFKNISGGTKQDLIHNIELSDVISFDLFDTLIMRRVFSYTDIFELVDCELRNRGIVISDFSKHRLAAEKELSKTHAPTLKEIYGYIIENTSDVSVARSISSDDLACELADTEFNIDKKTIIPRTDMVDIFYDITANGKKVYITTDTYYHKEQIEEILHQCNMSGYEDVFVSCEYGIGKAQGLFDVLKNYTADGAQILHVGNDDASDIEAAAQCGLCSYKIFGADELFDAAGGLGIEEYMVTISDRVKVGLLISRLFNSPFQFENEEKRIEITNAKDIGYIICAPIISDFLFWFKNRIDEYNIGNVWFSARDGFLLKKMYEMLSERKSTYFLTSRIAAIRAGMDTIDDIAYVDSMKFFGTATENLRVRFGIVSTGTDRSNQDKRLTCETDHEKIIGKEGRVSDIKKTEYGNGLCDYAEIILDKAILQRENYHRYIDTLNIDDDMIAIFDFVAKGTTQMYVQKLVNNHIKGLYFLQLEPEFMENRGLDIEPFYSLNEVDDSAIFDNYYILETVLTAPHPQILEFDGDGNPVYAEETRSKDDIQCFDKVQEGVLEYFKDYTELISESAHSGNKKLDEIILGLIHGIFITDQIFMELMVEDPFFNRMTEIKDLI